jgi:hypothetical protein
MMGWNWLGRSDNKNKKKLKDLKIQHEVKYIVTKMHIEVKQPRDQQLFANI